MSRPDYLAALASILDSGAVTSGGEINPSDVHDESLSAHPGHPVAVVRPRTAEQVSAVMKLCALHGVPVVPRGSGTGLSGAGVAQEGCLLMAFDQMNRIKEIDLENQVAVVEPGVTLAQLDEALAGTGLFYPVHPGERSGSIGGNVSTNAGGMRAIRDGVTRHHVLGLELVLADGSIVRSGGKMLKLSTGYDVTQLVIGSEGTLALVTEVIVKLTPRFTDSATLLAPFGSLEEITAAVPHLIATGLAPAVLEYLDSFTMAAVTSSAELELGIPESVTEQALAFLVIVVESTRADRLEGDVEVMAGELERRGAIDTYLLPEHAAAALIEARERAFYVAKANGATDIIDVVVPRAEVSRFLSEVGAIAQRRSTLVVGCGHVGDGNVHMSVFETDPTARHDLMSEIFTAGLELGGAISGEHGVGTEKLAAYQALSDPVRLDLEARIKEAFDPRCLLNPARSLRREATT
jgi:glycolate oxidase